MAEIWAAIIAAVALGLGIILTYAYSKKTEANRVRLEIKREALLQALNLTDAILSHKSTKSTTVKTDFTMEQVRSCYNTLTTVIDNKELLSLFRKAWGLGLVNPTFDIITDLRNEVRKEMGFGKDDIDMHRDKAFFGYIDGANKNNQNP